MENTKKVPVLRFPEFNEEWNIEKLKKFIIEHKGGAPLQPKDFVKYSQYEVIPKKSIIKGGYLQLDIENPTFCSEKFFNSYNNSVINNSYLITTLRDLVPSAPSIGYIVKIKNEKSYILAQGVYGLKINKEILSEDFLIQFSNTDNYREVMQTIKVGSTQVHIRNNDFFKITIGVPSKKEQQKIADFLSQIDNRIEKLTKKKLLLDSYKKGVIQQIFSQNIRFTDDDGREFSKWEVKKLGNIADLTSSKRVYLSDYVKEGIPFYRGKEISELKINKIPKDILYITRESYEAFKSSFGVPQIHDILITAVGTLGNVYRIKNESEFYFKDGNLIWLKNVKILSSFLEILLEINQEAIQKSSIGSTQRALTIIELKKIKFNIPDLQEQTKIANFLTEIDDKINLVSKQLEGTKQYKKGLLQKMFV